MSENLFTSQTMYHYHPVQEYECDKIQRALDILKGVIAREDKRHMMYEAARATVFERQGKPDHASECLKLKRFYERRAMEECSDPGPT